MRKRGDKEKEVDHLAYAKHKRLDEIPAGVAEGDSELLPHRGDRTLAPADGVGLLAVLHLVANYNHIKREREENKK